MRQDQSSRSRASRTSLPSRVDGLCATSSPARSNTESHHERLADRLPELLDLAAEAQVRIRRFAIEERLERGLPPVELLDLYRGFEIAGDDRARQYLDRVYVERVAPADWLDIQSEAGRLVDMAEARGRDAGRLFA